ncbi:hypothetical protein HW555_002804 [Spodoptera exigua]|uniref:Uncharacterized protein n=1 Tax=Spodoptera exigua TaxID=7107 RepID=A0A835L6P9_SPOEX|nr:hypothetical protein HW555_002804 [Spodoptera exigua]
MIRSCGLTATGCDEVSGTYGGVRRFPPHLYEARPQLSAGTNRHVISDAATRHPQVSPSYVTTLQNFLVSVYHVTDGQNFYDIEEFYKPIVFDNLNRGGYNITDCLSELLNCWEVIKPDVICTYDKYLTTVCDLLKETCDDYDGLVEEQLGLRLTLFENKCLWSWQEEATK